MTTVTVINPKNRKSPIRCSICSLKYSLRDYTILFDNKKLIYFYSHLKTSKRRKVICHDCLLKELKKLHPKNDIIKFEIQDGDDTYNCAFYANEIDEFPDEFF